MADEEAAAPWASVPPQEQLFVLITGANSGIGLATGKRLIDDFLASRSLAAHLVLIPTTRSAAKSRQTIRLLRDHVVDVAQTSARLRSRAGPEYRWQQTVARIHLLSLELDLCRLDAVRRFGRRLCYGLVSNPDGVEGEVLRRVRIPRLDCIICNAAYGGWVGCDFGQAIWSVLTKGVIQSATWPDFKQSLPTCILNERPEYGYPAKPLLGEVFTACVFGHYILIHELLPLLSRSADAAPPMPPARIIWSSSLEALDYNFSLDDLQGLARPDAYESAKRLTDILSLTCSLPSVRPISSGFLTGPAEEEGDKAGAAASRIPPNMYLTHPGIVASTLFPLPWFLFWAYRLFLGLVRLLGSPWHTVDGYSGAKAAVWVALEDQPSLDAAAAERVKWGSSSDRSRAVHVKMTEVDGWGWEGKAEDADTLAADPAVGLLRKSVGRRLRPTDVSAEDVAAFEVVGARAWRAMEHLRLHWYSILPPLHDDLAASEAAPSKGEES